jgi:N-acetylglucosaminyl-diphospho-decaprenol L-rhamnosyltransferase
LGLCGGGLPAGLFGGANVSFPTAPTVTAVIVTWRSASTIGRCLTSLADTDADVSVAAVVVDNASTDATAQEVERRAPWAKLIRNPTNRGLAAANNQGMREAAGEWVLISNPDVVYEPRTVPELVACAERHPRAAIVLPRLFNEDGSTQTSVGDLPRFREAMLGRGYSASRSAARGFWWDGWSHDTEIAVGHGAESCYLVNPAAMADVGMQDEKFALDWEGVDWAARFVAAGWEIWFTPAARATHIGAVSTRQARLRWIVRTHRGMYRYFALRSPRWLRPALAAAVSARALVKMAANVAPGLFEGRR